MTRWISTKFFSGFRSKHLHEKTMHLAFNNNKLNVLFMSIWFGCWLQNH